MKRKDLPKETQRCRGNDYRRDVPMFSHRYYTGRCRNKVSFHCEDWPYFLCKKHFHKVVGVKGITIEEYYVQKAENELANET